MPRRTALRARVHRGVKLRIGPMFGFKWFKTAAVTIGGVEPLLPIRSGSSTSVCYVLGINVCRLPGMLSWQPNKVATSHAHNHNSWLVILVAQKP